MAQLESFGNLFGNLYYCNPLRIEVQSVHGRETEFLSKAARTKTKDSCDVLIVNAKEMLTLADTSAGPRTGKRMRELGIVHDGALAIREGRIVAVGTTREVSRVFKAGHVINAQGKTILPGFVDPHTHLVFAGSREDEFQMRVEGASSMEISDSGDGIFTTVKETRRARVETLVELGLERLDVMLAHGTTTVEAKSGYGLTTSDELKILEATKRLNQLHSVNVVSTLMSANAIPPEFSGNPDAYVDLVAGETIPKVADKGLAEFCDVSCEKGIFSLEQAKRVLVKARDCGLKLKVHADQTAKSGGAEFAADVGAVSAEHLVFSSAQGVRALAAKGVVAVLLPAVAFSMMTGKYADARLIIDSGVPVALGTGFDGGCWVENQQLIIAMACHFMRMTPSEAITAATVNAAYAINRASEVGTLEVGKRADVLVLNAPNHKFLGYRFGVNLIDKVIKNGRLAVDREKQNEPIFLSKTE
jgi:imidazolonepropionase